jgi:hypothetical protein
MSLFKRGKWYWMDDVVNEVRCRLPLKTNWQQAKTGEKEKLVEIAQGKFGGIGKIARQTFTNWRQRSFGPIIMIKSLRKLAAGAVNP